MGTEIGDEKLHYCDAQLSSDNAPENDQDSNPIDLKHPEEHFRHTRQIPATSAPDVCLMSQLDLTMLKPCPEHARESSPAAPNDVGTLKASWRAIRSRSSRLSTSHPSAPQSRDDFRVH